MKDCIEKLDSMQNWNIEVSQCHWRKPGEKDKVPHYWGIEHIKKFNRLCRKHNQRIRHRGFNPEYGKRNDMK